MINGAYLLVGSWLNCMLFMLEISLMVLYFRTSRPLLHRIGVGAILAFDAVCTGAICAEVYTHILVFPCEAQVFTDSTLRPLAVILFSTYATASLEQLFLCALYFVLTKQRLITAFLVATVALHLALSYASAVLVLTTGSPGGSAFLTSKIGAISCSVTDVLIATALLYTLMRMEITSAVRVYTHSLLRRLMLLVFTSGVLVASTTILSMIFLLQGNPVYSLFFYAKGRVYSLTILGNFLVGFPAPPTPTLTNVPGTVVTGVVFHVDYQTSTNERAAVTYDYNVRPPIEPVPRVNRADRGIGSA
ncbi:hypothetical protein DFH09DRAFT_139498 [Mycena vulgaris]|nr:hypothetical protein DFH09DRAFT_139498 [Mycena vulgaris]